MPSIDATVAWAVPVEVEVLGAHLEAYVKLQPTINTLRMCHRFGKGDQAAITRLPVELLSEVEDLLMQEERRKTREEWETDFRCFQLQCDIRDHCDPSELEERRRIHCVELEEMRQRLYREVRQGCDECESDASDDDFVENQLDEYILDGCFQKTHWERRSRWPERVNAPTSSPMRHSLNVHANYFEKEFGLAIWTSHVSIDAPGEHYFEEDMAGKTTLAYLKLSSQQQRFEHDWPGNDQEYVDSGESGCGVRLKEVETPMDSEIRRFKRAIDMLGLRPRVHETQVLQWNICRDVWRGVAVDCNPQLMVLIRSSSD
ncbi:hypothetical protein KC338_g3800 [Hortaea werneckii]|nr:hypothetical protein KC338_g3800 [Hortaea werneckii]